MEEEVLDSSVDAVTGNTPATWWRLDTYQTRMVRCVSCVCVPGREVGGGGGGVRLGERLNGCE